MLHRAARPLLALGANRRMVSMSMVRRMVSMSMVSMSGELPADLTSCDVTRAQLEERIGVKRQRSFSSADSLFLVSLAATPEPLLCLHRNCKLHVGMRSDRGGHS
jgi:hypothetical protein